MKNNSGLTCYIGTIVEVIDKMFYTIKVDVPGFGLGLKAFPVRSEVDEPKIGDLVVLYNLDPIFNSYLLYQKLKENNFVGIRSNGKMVDITEDSITISTFDPNLKYEDGEKPELINWIKLTNSGEIEISSDSSIKIVTKDKMNIEVENAISVESKEIKVDGSDKLNLNSKDISITGAGGSLTTRGKSNTDLTGPYCGIPICPFSGAPHCGSKVTLT